MSPEGTTKIYSNLTPRSFKHFPGELDYAVVFGIQMTIREIVSNFDDYFFSKDKVEVCSEIKHTFSEYSQTDYDVSKIEALWELGHLPIMVKALPEGSLVKPGIPVLTIYNTDPSFQWVTNFLETQISNLIWKPMTSATIARQFKLLNDRWIAKTDEGNEFHSMWGCHDFSMRGLDSIFATMSSGLGHALFHHGSDSLPVIPAAKKYYDAKTTVIGSIPATEHSIQCAYYNGSDYDYIKTLIERFPSGPLGLVLDGFDLFKAITEDLPRLKEQIMAREGGPVVFRPDSGDPVDIICGTNPEFGYLGKEAVGVNKGVIELLWDIFGGTTNEQGYKILHPSVRVIYGDAISLERFNEINTRLEAKGFASTNWVAGVGSFTYQFNTRDTLGMAVKSTYQEVYDWPKTIVNSISMHDSVEIPFDSNNQAHLDLFKGTCIHENKSLVKGVNIFKDPKTDNGTKKSAKGLLYVKPADETGDYELVDQVTWEIEGMGALQPVFKDGVLLNQISFEELRSKTRSDGK